MIFLVEYNRSRGAMVSFRSFDDAQRGIAEDARLALELDLNLRGIAHEVVLLGAESEDALRRGYRRYFEDLTTLLQSTARSLEAMGPA